MGEPAWACCPASPDRREILRERRRIFIIGLLVFAGASLLGGFATGQAWLLSARAI